jgi:hypothetical protein
MRFFGLYRLPKQQGEKECRQKGPAPVAGLEEKINGYFLHTIQETNTYLRQISRQTT